MGARLPDTDGRPAVSHRWGPGCLTQTGARLPDTDEGPDASHRWGPGCLTQMGGWLRGMFHWAWLPDTDERPDVGRHVWSLATDCRDRWAWLVELVPVPQAPHGWSHCLAALAGVTYTTPA
eukprot:365759-Chlamydomonas_euryale.AAC.3